VPKSCQDYLDVGVKESGYYVIDPDGNGVGVDQFSVFCNFETGMTSQNLFCAYLCANYR
jgi:hypothetical protein